MVESESSRDFDDFLSDDDFASDVEIEVAEEGRSDRISDDDAEILDQIEIWNNKKPSWLNALVVLVVSGAIFTAVAAAAWDWKFVLMLIPVLLFHELGHMLAMLAFKYRNVRMFFIPFFGAAVTGHQYNIAGWKRAIVSLAGPLPGIALGVAIGILAMLMKNTAPQSQWEMMFQAALLLLTLNGLNLLPIFPLDGGRLLHTVLFVRHVALDVLFRIAAAIAMFAGSVYLKDKIGYFIGGAVLIGIPGAYCTSQIAKKVRERGLPSESPGGETIPTPTALAIIDELRIAYPRGLKNKTAAQFAVQVFEQMNSRPPGILATLGLGGIYVASLAVAVVAISMFILGSRMDLGRLRADILSEPKLPFECNSTRMANGKEFTGLPTGEEVTIVATFESREEAEQTFDELSPTIPPKSQATLFGQTLLLALPAEDAASRETWFAALDKRAKNVFVQSAELKAICTLVCYAKSEDEAKKIQEESSQYLRMALSAWLIAPWDPARSITEKNWLARKTIADIERAGARYEIDDPKYEVLQDEFREALRRGDQRKVDELRGELEKIEKDSRNAYLEEFRRQNEADADQEMIKLYEARPETNEEQESYDEAAVDDWFRRVGEHAGQLPLQDGNPAIADLRYSAPSGLVTNNSVRLQFRWVGFDRPNDGLVALLNWLCERGCVRFQYELIDPSLPFRRN